MSHDRIPQLDPLVHAPMRLAVMSILIGVTSADFTYIRDAIGATDGNLSAHLTRLESAGYITIKKSFKGKKPHTTCAITSKGGEAFLGYVEQLERIVKNQKQKEGSQE